MKKFLLFFCLCMAICCTSKAQSREYTTGPSPVITIKNPIKRTTGSLNFRYYQDNSSSTSVWWSFAGTLEQEFAIYIPGDYAGKQIANISLSCIRQQESAT